MDKTTVSAALPSLTRLLTRSMDFRRLAGAKGDGVSFHGVPRLACQIDMSLVES